MRNEVAMTCTSIMIAKSPEFGVQEYGSELTPGDGTSHPKGTPTP